MKQIFPPIFYNPVTLVGAAVAVISFGLILFLIVLEALADEHKPYMGIIAFIILPSIMIIGIIILILGMVREHRREKAGLSTEHRLPTIDLNDVKQRKLFLVFFTGTILLLLFTAFGSFKAYEYTDSDEFCGTVCHKVMEPEYTAYRFSPHARVGCVSCHIGPGADWFVRSKLSGAYQLYSVTFNQYSRPIPTPIRDLRPAQETCEQCHWPSHFYSEKKHENTYFNSDEANSRWKLTMLMKIGGGNDETGVTSGIHWHMNIDNEITYIHTDERRMDIPWVKVKSRDGTETIYTTTERDVTDEELRAGTVRRMDCIDCHNRPSHQFHPPTNSVNHFMAIGEIDPELPYIKGLAVEALESSYSTKNIALDSIRISIEDFYNNRYPEIAAEKQTRIERTIRSVQRIYSRNYFPEMMASWKAFPDQIGHMFAPGCFRCHSGNHVSETGKVISHDCNVCHTLLAQEYDNEELAFSLEGVDYLHPVDIGDSWADIVCSDCHGE
jgi:hypothetical protein